MKVKKRFFIDGRQVSELEYDRRKKAQGVYNGGASQTYSEARPLTGMAAGVHPNQVVAARERVRALGLIGVDYASNGEIKFSSKGMTGRKGFLKAFGMHDNDGNDG